MGSSHTEEKRLSNTKQKEGNEMTVNVLPGEEGKLTFGGSGRRVNNLESSAKLTSSSSNRAKKRRAKNRTCSFFET